MWARYAVVVAVVAGCSVEGTPLREWTLDVDGGRHDVRVELPASLASYLPMEEVTYTLRRTVELRPDQRDRALGVVLDCFHGPIVFALDGSVVPTAGEGSGGGSWRFVIPPSATHDGTIALSFTVLRNGRTALGFGAAPRLTDDFLGDPRWRWVTGFNRYTAIACAGFIFMLAVLYGALVLLDRSRREYTAMLIYALASTSTPLLQLGVMHDVFGVYGAQVQGALMLVGTVAMLYFVHYTFELGRVRRGWIVLSCLSLVAMLAALTSYKASIFATLLFLPVIFTLNVCVLYCVVRAAGRATHRVDAIIMLAGFAPAVVSLIQAFTWFFTGESPLGGLHPAPASLAISTATLALILGRQHAQRQRAIETANLELRRQVAERSRELGEALATLGRQAAHPIGVGTTIDGRYRVIDKLGAGGMGSVYTVERVADGQRLALKTLRGRGEPELMARFAREAQIAAELAHPNLVPVLDVGVTDGSLFLVMPLVTGGSLEVQRSRFGDTAWAQALLGQIAAGLAALHGKGIVHRDLKPANVLVDSGVARIADFGLATLSKQPPRDDEEAKPVSGTDATVTGKLNRGEPALTRHGDVFGTPLYMAPELDTGVHAVKPSADIFAFGVIAYELLTGAKAFAEPPMVLRMRGTPIPPVKLDALPAALRNLVSRCLDLDPAKRPTAAELVSELIT